MRFTKSESRRIFLGYLFGYFGLQLLAGILYGIYYVKKHSTTVPEELAPKVGAIILIVSSCFVFILLLLAAKRKLSIDLKKLFKGRHFGAIFFGFALLFALNMVLGIIYSLIGVEVNPENQIQLNKMISVAPALMLISTTLLIPFVEEIVFRGVILDFFEKRFGAFTGILISSLMFGFMHVMDPASLIFLPVYVTPGILFGILYLKFDRNLWIPIGAHLLNNFIVVLAQVLIS